MMTTRRAAVLELALAVLALLAAASAAPGAAPGSQVTFGRRFGSRGFAFESEPAPAPSLVSTVSRLAAATSQIAAASAQLRAAAPAGSGAILFGGGFATSTEAKTETTESTPTETPTPTDPAETETATAESAVEQLPTDKPETESSTPESAPNPDPTSDSTPESTPVTTAPESDPVTPAEVTSTSASSASLASSGSSASSASTGDPLFFPDQPTSLSAKTGDAFVPKCDGVPYMARNAVTDRCQFLMMRTDCPEGEWFILDRETRAAACRPRPCPGEQVLYDGECRSRDDPALCPEGMVALVNEYGDAACDCAVRHVYWPAHDRCYPAFRQGPCHVGQYLTVTEAGVRCSPNVCVRDGAVFWSETRRCYRLQDEANSPCELGRLDVSEETLELECVETQLNAIFDLPVVRCSKGSKLDYGGRCKRELYQKFRSSFASGAASKKKCPEGFVAGPSGRCLRKAPTLG